MVLLSWSDAVDIGYGRGRLAAPAAASLARVDAQMRDAFGRVLDINEAWRSPADADHNYWLYSTGQTSIIALPAKDSIHCRGYAIDTDDGYNTRAVWILNQNGWFHTVFRGGRLVEPWHFEYDASRDIYRNQTAGNGATPFPTEEDDMFTDEDRAKADARGIVLHEIRQILYNAGLTDTAHSAAVAADRITEVRQILYNAGLGQLAQILDAVSGDEKKLDD